MFNVGDEVRVRSNGAAGTVVYAEDGYISVELSNGTEQDFEDIALLMTEEEFQENKSTKVSVIDSMPFTTTPYVPRKGDRRLASSVINSIMKIYPGLLDAMKVKDPAFNELDAFDKVKMLSDISGTPMVVFMGAGEMGEEMMRNVIGKTLLNNILDGTDLTMDILLGMAHRTIDEHNGE